MTVSNTVCVGSTPAVPANLNMFYGGMGELVNSLQVYGGARELENPPGCGPG